MFYFGFMNFKIFDYKRKGVNHVYLIRGEGRWSLLDLVPRMLEVSKRSRDYALQYDMTGGEFAIIDKRAPDKRRATLTLEGTLAPEINRVRIFDEGVGKQMIDKYLRSVENSQ